VIARQAICHQPAFGHEGGANELALKVGNILDAER
jgi:hypothetical protein